MDIPWPSGYILCHCLSFHPLPIADPVAATFAAIYLSWVSEGKQTATFQAVSQGYLIDHCMRELMIDVTQ